MSDKKYEVLKIIKRNGSIKYLIDIEPEDINEDFFKNLSAEIKAGVYDDLEVEEM